MLFRSEIQIRQRAEFIDHQKTAFENLVRAGKMTREDADTALKALGASDNAEAARNYIDIDPKPEIVYEDFDRMQLRVGEVLECEEVPKSKKLLKFKIRMGSETRQILSGIKASYNRPEELVGKKLIVLTNLKPREIMGMTSEGMILSAIDEDDNLSLLTIDRDMPAGAEVD